jgi:hypothetical protein
VAALTIYPAADSFLQFQSPDTNFGSNESMQEGAFYAGGAKAVLCRTIANFDVSAIASRTITAAKIIRTVWSRTGSGEPATVYRCTRPSTWTEGGVTWKKYDGTNNWTTAGGDMDGATPTPVGYTLPGSTGEMEITGLAGFVTDAIASRGNIVSMIFRLDDEGPGSTQWHLWHSGEAVPSTGHPWRLVVEHDGPPIGVRRERYFLRGVMRGVMRGER